MHHNNTTPSNTSSSPPVLESDNIAPPQPGHRWGGWIYNGNYLTHQYPHYEIDLERCVDAATTLDWVLQVADKSWCTTDDIGHLFLALVRTVGYRLR